MKYLLIITMLLGAGYSQDCDPAYWNCDCNEDTWQEYYDSEGHNMEGCYLQGANLSSAILYYADLSDANLKGAILYQTNLMLANLAGANLMDVYSKWGIYLGANLTGANLTGTNPQGADFSSADFSYANLQGADFTNAFCRAAFFVGANLEETIFYSTYVVYAFFDEDEDGSDDVSHYAGYRAGALSGDLNLDGTDNVQDVVILVNNILLTP